MPIVQSSDDFLFSIGIVNNNAVREASLSHPHFEDIEQEEQKPCKKDLKFINAHIRDFVRIRHTDYIGQIVGVNFRTHGMFPGDRCPVWVSMLNKSLVGTSSCYSVSQIEIISKRDAEDTLTRLNNGLHVSLP